jgi:hypothetical protein
LDPKERSSQAELAFQSNLQALTNRKAYEVRIPLGHGCLVVGFSQDEAPIEVQNQSVLSLMPRGLILDL